MERDHGRRSTVWMTVAILLFALLAAACTGDEQADGDGAAAPEGTQPPSTTLTTPVVTISVPEAGSDTPGVDSNGIEVGFTEDGYPYRGSPSAPVTVLEYSDYACPFCERYTAQNVPALLEQYARDGRVRFVFRDFPLVSLHPTAPIAHASAICAGEQSAELYWALHDAIFAHQADWVGLPDPTEALHGLAEEAGVDVAVYKACIASNRHDAEIEAGVAEASALGFDGTPSFHLIADGLDETFTIIGAQPLETFQTYLDSLLAGNAPADAGTSGESAEASEPAALPFWADRETGLRPDPDRPGVNLAGDHYKGNPDAPLVVIEFSDFECPFCGEHATNTQPAIDQALVDSGEVLWVFKHLPLDGHPNARVAAVAAECAGDQGQFWKAHDLLFETAATWGGNVTDVDAALLDVVSELPLDGPTFERCFAGRAALERVLADVLDAKGIISQTPSFVVIQGDRGSLMQGSIPADEFIASLQGRLADQDDAESAGDG